MALLVFNKSAAAVTLTGITAGPQIPASSAPPANGPAVNVTAELMGLTGAQYAALQSQASLVPLSYAWTSFPEYATPGLTVAAGPTTPQAHESTHATGGSDALTVVSHATGASVNSATTGVTAAGSSHTHTVAVVRHETFKLPNATAAAFSGALALGTSQPVTPTAQPNCPRVCQVATSGAGFTTTTAIAVTVTGTKADGTTDTDVITITAAGGAQTVQGAKAFAKITNYTYTTPVSWTSGTFSVQAGTAVGLAHSSSDSGATAFKEVGYTDSTPAPADATVGTVGATNFTYIPTTALDGLHDVEVWWSTAVTSSGTSVTVTVTDGGHTHTLTDGGHTHNLT